MNGNCYDTCLLEWCKLFGEPKGEHHWSQVVSDVAAFEAALYKAVGVEAKAFEAFRIGMRDYRDKFVAHLDRELTANLPHFDMPQASVWFYHAHVVTHELKPDGLGALPAEIGNYYDAAATEASKVHGA